MSLTHDNSIGPGAFVSGALGAVLLSLLSFGGCGSSDLASVRGRVTIDGHPAEGVLVQFQPTAAGGTSSSAITDAQGRYNLMYTFRQHGAEPGAHVVTLRSAADYYEEDCAGEETQPPPGRKINVQRRVVVEPGRNTIDFDL